MVVQEAPRSQPDWHLAFEFAPFHRSRTTTKIRASVETATGSGAARLSGACGPASSGSSGPGSLWQLDMSSIWFDEHGWTYRMAIIDCCTLGRNQARSTGWP